MAQKEELIIKGTDEVAKMHNLSDEQIIKSFVIKSEENGSKQLIHDEEFSELYSNGEAIEPLYNPLLWASLMEKNTRLAKLIRTYARNTVGLGWGIYPKKPITKDTTDEEKAQIESETEILEELFEAPNPDLPFSEVMYQVKVDEESTGNGYLEVSRNLNGEIDGMYHIPSHTMRILKNLKGYVQIRNGNKRYFKKFGEKQDIDMYSGEMKGSIAFNKRGNEIIHFRIYTPRDSYYGVPRYVAAADAIAGNKMAARRNLAFFKNDATPRMAITVENGKLDGHSINEIRNFVNTEGKGPENAHRVMILQAQQKQMGGLDQKDVKINVIPLTVGQTDDASHIKYRSANDEELREAFGIAEVFLGAKGSVNRATAMVSRAITNDQEFVPDAQVKEYKVNQTICKAFGVKKVKFEFERPAFTDELGKAEIFTRYLQGGGITPNDIRHELGKDEYDFEWADMPIQMAMVEKQMDASKEQGKDNEEKPTNATSGRDAAKPLDDKNQTNQDAKENAKVEAKVKAIVNLAQEMINKNIQSMMIDIDDDFEGSEE
jgi:PBSX family phage portal protein